MDSSSSTGNQKMKIAVCGATGAQGGSLVDALLKFPDQFTIRALTRNTNSVKANQLKEKGVELQEADFDKPDTIEKAFQGCQGAFLVTNFWEHFDVQKEINQAKTLGNECKKAGVKHIIWSTLDDTMKFQDDIPLIGNYKVPHFDGKAEVSKYFDSEKLPVTHLYTSFYYENLTGMMKCQKGDDGIRKLTMPMGDKKLPINAVADIGKVAAVCFQKEIKGNVPVSSDCLTGEEIASVLTETTGEKFEYFGPPAEVYRTFGFPGCDDLANMFQFYAQYNEQLLESRSLEKVKKMIQTIPFKEWCIENKEKLIN